MARNERRRKSAHLLKFSHTFKLETRVPRDLLNQPNKGPAKEESDHSEQSPIQTSKHQQFLKTAMRAGVAFMFNLRQVQSVFAIFPVKFSPDIFEEFSIKRFAPPISQVHCSVLKMDRTKPRVKRSTT